MTSTTTRPVDPNLVLSNISSLYTLPQHVWGKYVGSNGKYLKTFRPKNSLPAGVGRPLPDHQVLEEGHDRLQAQPRLLGRRPLR